MKRLALLFAVVVMYCGPAPSQSQPEPTIRLALGATTLQVLVERVKPSLGPVYCDLFNAEAGFPGASPIVGGGLRLAASTQPIACSYEKLPAGRYAVSVIQDENDNGTLDTSVFGAPVEGYGASNNKLPPTSAPTFQDSSFEVDGVAAVSMTVRLSN
jgi:uncharacterized protein (DUF2141 family)